MNPNQMRINDVDPDCPWCDSNKHVMQLNPGFGVSSEPLFRCKLCGNSWRMQPTLRKEDLMD